MLQGPILHRWVSGFCFEHVSSEESCSLTAEKKNDSNQHIHYQINVCTRMYWEWIATLLFGFILFCVTQKINLFVDFCKQKPVLSARFFELEAALDEVTHKVEMPRCPQILLQRWIACYEHSTSYKEKKCFSNVKKQTVYSHSNLLEYWKLIELHYELTNSWLFSKSKPR